MIYIRKFLDVINELFFPQCWIRSEGDEVIAHQWSKWSISAGESNLWHGLKRVQHPPEFLVTQLTIHSKILTVASLTLMNDVTRVKRVKASRELKSRPTQLNFKVSLPLSAYFSFLQFFSGSFFWISSFDAIKQHMLPPPDTWHKTHRANWLWQWNGPWH